MAQRSVRCERGVLSIVAAETVAVKRIDQRISHAGIRQMKAEILTAFRSNLPSSRHRRSARPCVPVVRHRRWTGGWLRPAAEDRIDYDPSRATFAKLPEFGPARHPEQRLEQRLGQRPRRRPSRESIGMSTNLRES